MKYSFEGNKEKGRLTLNIDFSKGKDEINYKVLDQLRDHCFNNRESDVLELNLSGVGKGDHDLIKKIVTRLSKPPQFISAIKDPVLKQKILDKLNPPQLDIKVGFKIMTILKIKHKTPTCSNFVEMAIRSFKIKSLTIENGRILSIKDYEALSKLHELNKEIERLIINHKDTWPNQIDKDYLCEEFEKGSFRMTRIEKKTRDAKIEEFLRELGKLKKLKYLLIETELDNNQESALILSAKNIPTLEYVQGKRGSLTSSKLLLLEANRKIQAIDLVIEPNNNFNVVNLVNNIAKVVEYNNYLKSLTIWLDSNDFDYGKEREAESFLPPLKNVVDCVAKSYAKLGELKLYLDFDYKPEEETLEKIKELYLVALNKICSENTELRNLELFLYFPDYDKDIQSISSSINRAVAEVLQKSPNVTTLELTQHTIDEDKEGAMLLFESIKQAKNLKNITLSAGASSDLGDLFEMLAKLTRDNLTLKSFSLSFSKGFNASESLIKESFQKFHGAILENNELRRQAKLEPIEILIEGRCNNKKLSIVQNEGERLKFSRLLESESPNTSPNTEGGDRQKLRQEETQEGGRCDL